MFLLSSAYLLLSLSISVPLFALHSSFHLFLCLSLSLSEVSDYIHPPAAPQSLISPPLPPSVPISQLKAAVTISSAALPGWADPSRPPAGAQSGPAEGQQSQNPLVPLVSVPTAFLNATSAQFPSSDFHIILKSRSQLQPFAVTKRPEVIHSKWESFPTTLAAETVVNLTK